MTINQTIYRKHKRSRYTTVDNGFIVDSSLSFKAKGILLYLFSKPDDWRAVPEDIARASNDGITSVRSGLKELEQAGYLERVKLRNELGQIHWVTYIHEQPKRREPTSGSATDGEPTYGKPTSGESVSGKPEHILNTDLPIPEVLKTEVLRTEVEPPYNPPAADAACARVETVATEVLPPEQPEQPASAQTTELAPTKKSSGAARSLTAEQKAQVIALWQRCKAPMWRDVDLIGTKREKLVQGYIRHYGSFEAFCNALDLGLRYAAQDSWWSIRKMTIDKLLGSERIIEMAESGKHEAALPPQIQALSQDPAAMQSAMRKAAFEARFAYFLEDDNAN